MDVRPASDALIWDGATEPCLDHPVLETIGHVEIGRFGGSTRRGARKNEDAALVWIGRDWVFATVLDAHGGSASATTLLSTLAAHRARLETLLADPDPRGLLRVQAMLGEMLTCAETSARMAALRGETACLMACQKGRHLLWVSVGDNMLYLIHPDLARLGQHSLTVRNFFEWIGERSSVAGPVPCFSSGIRELRQGNSTIALATDGLLEMGEQDYERPAAFAEALASEPNLHDAVDRLLGQAREADATDSCTIIAWSVDNPFPALMPSA